MNTEESDFGFSTRVHQGHIDNFLRKVNSAESSETLQRLIEVIDFAFQRNMIDQSGHDMLKSAIDHQFASLPTSG